MYLYLPGYLGTQLNALDGNAWIVGCCNNLYHYTPVEWPLLFCLVMQTYKADIITVSCALK